MIKHNENKMKWTDENKVKAGAAGGVEAAVKAINTHIDNIDLCRKGCIALMSQVSMNSKRIHDKHNIYENLSWEQ